MAVINYVISLHHKHVIVRTPSRPIIRHPGYSPTKRVFGWWRVGVGLRSTRGQVTGPDRKGGTKGIRLITTFEFGELLLAVVLLRVERIRYSSRIL